MSHSFFESILRTTYVRFIANFTLCFIDDARASTFTFICALTIDTTRYVAVARTVHEIQRFNVSVEFGNQISTDFFT